MFNWVECECGISSILFKINAFALSFAIIMLRILLLKFLTNISVLFDYLSKRVFSAFFPK